MPVRRTLPVGQARSFAANSTNADEADSDDAFKPIRRAPPPPPKTASGEIDYPALVHKLVSESPIFLFMKGDPQMPRCGYSKQVVTVLKQHKVRFNSYDVLENDYAICDAVEAYRQWPTFPQLYVSGELVGGCDIVTDLHRNGELADILSSAKAIAPTAGKA